MRKIVYAIAILAGTVLSARRVRASAPTEGSPSPGGGLWARDFRSQVTPFVSYQLWGSTPIQGGSLRIANTPAYGVIFDVPTVVEISMVEFAFMRQETELDFRSETMPQRKLFGMSVDYLHVGLVTEMLPWRIRPFAGVTLGATLFEPHASVDNQLQISASVEGGVKIVVTRNFGVRAHARLTTTFGTPEPGAVCTIEGCTPRFTGGGLLHGDLGLGIIVFL
jgi:hypothetical protein